MCFVPAMSMVKMSRTYLQETDWLLLGRWIGEMKVSFRERSPFHFVYFKNRIMRQTSETRSWEDRWIQEIIREHTGGAWILRCGWGGPRRLYPEETLGGRINYVASQTQNLCIFDLHAPLSLISIPLQLPESLDSSLHRVFDSSFFLAASQV